MMVRQMIGTVLIAAYLAKFKPVVDLMLERAHLHLPYKGRVDLGLLHHQRDKLSKMREDDVRFIMCGRV